MEIKIQLLHPLIGLLHISHWGGNSELLKLVKVTDRCHMTWVIYELIISRSGYILCAVHAQQQAIVTKTETTTTPRGLCFNLSQTLEVDDIMWLTCRGDEERGRKNERRRAVIHQQLKKRRRGEGGCRDGTLFFLPLQLHHYPLAETFCSDWEANQTYGRNEGEVRSLLYEPGCSERNGMNWFSKELGINPLPQTWHLPVALNFQFSRWNIIFNWSISEVLAEICFPNDCTSYCVSTLPLHSTSHINQVQIEFQRNLIMQLYPQWHKQSCYTSSLHL